MRASPIPEQEPYSDRCATQPAEDWLGAIGARTASCLTRSPTLTMLSSGDNGGASSLVLNVAGTVRLGLKKSLTSINDPPTSIVSYVSQIESLSWTCVAMTRTLGRSTDPNGSPVSGSVTSRGCTARTANLMPLVTPSFRPRLMMSSRSFRIWATLPSIMPGRSFPSLLRHPVTSHCTRAVLLARPPGERRPSHRSHRTIAIGRHRLGAPGYGRPPRYGNHLAEKSPPVETLLPG